MEKKIEHVRFAGADTVIGAQDGESFTFRLHATDGQACDISMSIDEAGLFIAFLAEVAGKVRRNRDDGTEKPTDRRNALFPLEAEGMGFVPVDDDLARLFPETLSSRPDQRPGALVVRLSGFDLAFRTGQIKISDLPEWLHAEAAKIRRSLPSAGDGKGG